MWPNEQDHLKIGKELVIKYYTEEGKEGFTLGEVDKGKYEGKVINTDFSVGAISYSIFKNN